MLDAGEDPLFIARRIVVLSCEDIGMADPQALVVAQSAASALQFVGMPEGRLILSQAVVYMAKAPKSNASFLGIDKALGDVRRGKNGAVPNHLKDAHYQGAAELGHGLGYKYPHDYPEGWVDQRYLPDGLERGCFYHPSERGWEAYRADAAARDRAAVLDRQADVPAGASANQPASGAYDQQVKTPRKEPDGTSEVL